jgi:hypothetical protein
MFASTQIIEELVTPFLPHLPDIFFHIVFNVGRFAQKPLLRASELLLPGWSATVSAFQLLILPNGENDSFRFSAALYGDGLIILDPAKYLTEVHSRLRGTHDLTHLITSEVLSINQSMYPK